MLEFGLEPAWRNGFPCQRSKLNNTSPAYDLMLSCGTGSASLKLMMFGRLPDYVELLDHHPGFRILGSAFLRSLHDWADEDVKLWEHWGDARDPQDPYQLQDAKAWSDRPTVCKWLNKVMFLWGLIMLSTPFYTKILLVDCDEHKWSCQLRINLT